MPSDLQIRHSAAGQDPTDNVIPLNIPNSLTILRIVLIPVFVGFLIYGRYTSALLTLLVAGITDALDGTIARLANQQTQFGAYLDPLADKLLLMSSFITLAGLELVPAWSVILVVSRDAMLLAGTLLAHLTAVRMNVDPTVLGKMTTLCQLIYVFLVVALHAWSTNLFLLEPVLYVMSGLTVASGLRYVFRGIKQLHPSP
ncbi:MAG: CDP-diacylglycerol--glycerol-3-phosphate 3-phosphatidyltransferase [Nitrospirales bacterium]|nr:CDP-diacylglycerol--glycerol-3-phosphate 3-phosphatidyltransferase [Nitrospirales bacterium]